MLLEKSVKTQGGVPLCFFVYLVPGTVLCEAFSVLLVEAWMRSEPHVALICRVGNVQTVYLRGSADMANPRPSATGSVGTARAPLWPLPAELWWPVGDEMRRSC